MKKIDQDGLRLCELQAAAFEKSTEENTESSAIFIRRFMHSHIANAMDTGALLQTNLQPRDILDRVAEEYGTSEYGSVTYTKNEMYWIGYLYRYMVCITDRSSVQVYRIIKPKELRGLFLSYHSLDPAQAVERILEAKDLLLNEQEELERQFRIYKRIRQESEFKKNLRSPVHLK